MKMICGVVLALFLGGGAGLVMGASNANRVYTAYTLGRDERGVLSVARDKIVKTKIQAAIAHSKNLSNFDLDVSVIWGHAYVVGEVENSGEIEQIANILKTVGGVRKGRLYVRLKSERKCSLEQESAIRQKLVNELVKDSAVASTNIGVSVVQCDVVFTGAVDDIEQEKRILWYAYHSEGVREIHSYLFISGKR